MNPNIIYYHPSQGPPPQYYNQNITSYPIPQGPQFFDNKPPISPQNITSYPMPQGPQFLDNKPYLMSTHHSGKQFFIDKEGQPVFLEKGHHLQGQTVVLDKNMTHPNLQNPQVYTEKNNNQLFQSGQNIQKTVQTYQTMQNIQTTQPIVIEKIHKQQIVVERPVITREIVYQTNMQPMYMQHQVESLQFSPSKLRRSRSLSLENENFMMQNSQIIENDQNKTLETSTILQPSAEKSSQDEKIMALEKQISIYREELEKSYKENQEYKKKVAKYEFIIQDYENRLRSSAEGQNLIFTQEIDKYRLTYEGHFSLMTQEIDKYKALLIKKEEEIQLLHQELYEKEDLKSDLNKISSFLSTKIKETEECKTRLSEKDAIFSEIEKKMQILMDEIERLNVLLKKKIEEVNFLSVKITETQTFSHQSFEKNEVLSREIDRLNALIRENNKELETWRFKYAEYSGLTLQIQDLLVKIVLMAGEIEALRMRIAGSEKEVDDMRRSNILKTLGEI